MTKGGAGIVFDWDGRKAAKAGIRPPANLEQAWTPDMAKKKKENEGETFEQLVEKVEKYVRELETGELGIEEAMTRYEDGIGAIRECRRILDEAEKRIEILIAREDGSYEARPFDPSQSPSGENGPAPRKARGRAASEETGELPF